MIIDREGQIRLPAGLLAELGLQAGDQLMITRAGEELILRPLPRDIVIATYGLAHTFWQSVGGSGAFVREMAESWRS